MATSDKNSQGTSLIMPAFEKQYVMFPVVSLRKSCLSFRCPCSLHQLLSLFKFLSQLLSILLSLACEICQSHSTGSYRPGRQQEKEGPWAAQSGFAGACGTEHFTGCPIPETVTLGRAERVAVGSVCEMLCLVAGRFGFVYAP